MKGILFFSILVFSGSVLASDKFTCEYATADISVSSKLNLIIKGSASVVFDGQSFTAYRPDGTYVITPPLTEKKDGMLFLDDKTKVFAASLDKANFAVSDRIKKTTEQWAKCKISEDKKGKEKINSDVKKQMQLISTIPWNGPEANKFFLREKHLFMLSQCGWAGSVGFSTGSKPLVMIGDSFYPGEKSVFKNGEYSITFNGGSMFVSYNPQKVMGYISDAHSFTPCAVVRLGED